MKRNQLILVGVLLCFAVGCTGDRVQSALHPAAPEAAEIARLWWFVFLVCAAVFVIVVGLLAWGILVPRRAEAQPPGGAHGFVVVGGMIIPGLILVGMFLYSLKVTVGQRPPTDALVIEITGHQWWWDVYYPEHGIRTANEFYIPAGQKVRLEVRSADVVHSLWIPNLHGKIDLLPEKSNTWYLRADKPGTYRGQCAEYCGLQHALMAIFVEALPPDEFEEWIESRKEPSVISDPILQHGKEVFFARGCDTCHAISGTEAEGRIGPDLTHVGSRLTLGAGTLTNNFGNLAGWISNPQPLKPGNLMPATYMDGDELQALVTYLRSLQ